MVKSHSMAKTAWLLKPQHNGKSRMIKATAWRQKPEHEGKSHKTMPHHEGKSHITIKASARLPQPQHYDKSHKKSQDDGKSCNSTIKATIQGEKPQHHNKSESMTIKITTQRQKPQRQNPQRQKTQHHEKSHKTLNTTMVKAQNDSKSYRKNWKKKTSTHTRDLFSLFFLFLFGVVVLFHWLESVPSWFASILESEESDPFVEIMCDMMVTSYFKGSRLEKQNLLFHFLPFFFPLSQSWSWSQIHFLCSSLFNMTHSERPLPLPSTCQKDQ